MLRAMPRRLSLSWRPPLSFIAVCGWLACEASFTLWRALPRAYGGAGDEGCAFDWDAYMEQARRLVRGPPPGSGAMDFDYAALRGDTGPLVYPAGHAWLHAGLAAALRWDADTDTTETAPKPLLAEGGTEPRYAARVHRPEGAIAALAALYTLLHCGALAAAAAAFAAATAPLTGGGGGGGASLALACVLLSLSRRVRSTAALGFFNDTWATLAAQAGVALAARRQWTVAALALSAGVSIKMNVLLYAPGMLYAVLDGGGVRAAALAAAAAAALQLVLAAPFLVAAPRAYLTRAFDLGRAFDQRWSVNLAFLPRAVFLHRALAAVLLVAHLVMLAAAARFMWPRRGGGGGGGGISAAPTFAVAPLRRAARATSPPAPSAARQSALDWLLRGARSGEGLSSRGIVFALYSSNFIGVACARSLHFQFFVWYFHALPLLLRHTRLPWPAHVAFVLALELCWGHHPPAAWSSACVTTLHVLLLAALWDGGGRLHALGAAARLAEPLRGEGEADRGSAEAEPAAQPSAAAPRIKAH